MRLLIVEDDSETAGYIAKGLGEAGHVADVAPNGREGLILALSEDYDLAIVDRMLPELDGLSLVEALRKAGRTTPVLFLSALGQVQDRVKGLKGGGDDYLVKPFAFAELLARVEALGRRGTSAPGESPVTKLRVHDLEMDLLAHSVSRAGQEIVLQPREFALLRYLMERAGQVVTRTMLLEGVWDYHFDPQTNVIDVHVSRLRQKIDRGFDPALLQTVRGAGYRLQGPQASDEAS